MPIIETHKLIQGEPLVAQRQVYNGLDACVTFEIWEKLRKQLGNDDRNITYSFERALQAPALEMMLRGFKIDEYARREGIAELDLRLRKLDATLQRFAAAVWDKPLNPRSQKQLLSFFYGTMRLPEQWTSKKGERKLSMDREALEKLQIYLYAQPVISVILAIRETSKQREVLETEIDPDGRMRTSYNIAGTETLRWSSSGNAFGTGTNLQNITPSLRHVFIADGGWKLCGIDLEQAESREVGWLCGTLFGDWTYLDACEHGDLHTTTAKLIWTDLPWSGDTKRDRVLADGSFYRHFSRRDMSKRGGHGSNYYGTPFTMAKHLKVPTKLMEEFQAAYFSAFPGIPKWHRWVAQQLQQTSRLTMPFGVTRQFFGRPNDDTTLREAIAFSPQSSTGVRMNLGLWRLWKYMGTRIRLLAQVHDAVYFLYREADEAAIIAEAMQLITNIYLTDPVSGRKFTVGGEAKVGWNWGNYTDQADIEKALLAKKTPPKLNLNGLKKYKGPETRIRIEGINRVL